MCVCARAGSCPQCAHFFLLQMQLLLDTEEVVVVFRQPPPLLPLPLPLHLPRGDVLTLATAHRRRPDSDPAATPARALSLQPRSVQVNTHKCKHTQCLLKSPGPRAYTSHVLLNSTLNIYWNNTLVSQKKTAWFSTDFMQRLFHVPLY